MILNSLIYLLGGIGLFLYGMKLMSDGLELSTGSKLKRILELLTKNKFIGVLVGFFVTAIIQSSTAMTVMVVGFVNAGLMTLSQSVGVIIGANVGTTTTGLIIALNIHNFAPFFIFVGAILLLFTKKRKLKYIGMVALGFGVLFLGLRVMSDAMKPLSDLPLLSEIFRYTENPFFGIILGFTLTALVQSSTASLGILVAMITSGIITDLNQAIFILYGQNIGTCITAIISSLGLNTTAKKAAMIHFIYNIIGISIFVVVTLLPLGFVDFIKGLSTNPTQQLVYTHIIINILMAIILLPVSKLLVKIANVLITDNKETKSDIDFVYIDEKLLNNPNYAIVGTYKEIERLAGIAFENYLLTQSVVLGKSINIDKDLKVIQKNENTINLMSGKISEYITKLNEIELEYSDAKLVTAFFHVITDIERMGNHSVNIIKAFNSIKEEENALDKEAMTELSNVFTNVEKALTKSIKHFTSGEDSHKKVAEVQKIENEVDSQNEKYKNNHIKRANNNECSFAGGVAFVKMLTDLERIADYACNIAYFQYKKSI